MYTLVKCQCRLVSVKGDAIVSHEKKGVKKCSALVLRKGNLA